jgi:tetratricopeptide (TPR) repeat protein
MASCECVSLWYDGHFAAGERPSLPFSIEITSLMTPPTFRQKIALVALLVAPATFVLYSGSLNNDFIGWDDEHYIAENPYITPLSVPTIVKMFGNFYFSSWTPLTLLSHAIDFSLWGLDPRGHHLTNLVIHSLNTVWMLLLSVALLDAYRRRLAGPPVGEKTGEWETALLVGGTASALMFAWHPIRVESVVCASSRKDLLSAFFAFPSLLLYLLYSLRRGAEGSWRLYAGSVFLFVLSLLAKGSVMTLAGILFIIDFIVGGFGGGPTRWRRLLMEKVPYAVLGLAAAAVAYIAARGGENVPQVVLARAGFSNLEIGTYDVSFYLLKTLWPARIAELYVFPRGGGFLALLITAPAVTLICAFLWVKGYRSGLYAWSAYFINLLPMAGFVPSSIQVLSNRYAYFAATSFCILFGGGVVSAWTCVRLIRKGRAVVLLPVSLMLIVLAAETIGDVSHWRDAETIWRYTIEVSPTHPLAHNEMGLAFLEKREYSAAIASFKRAVELYPGFQEAICNMGGAYISMGDTAEADSVLHRALALAPRDYATFTNLGNLRMVEKRFVQADSLYRISVSLNPKVPITVYDLGYARMLMGRNDDALALFQRAIQLNPNYRDAYFLMGEILSTRKGREEEALSCYRRAAQMGQEQAQRKLAERGLEW